MAAFDPVADSIRDACSAHGFDDLAASVPRIRQFVDEWWRQTLLPWFTDHGPAHSARVAEYAQQISNVPNLPAGIELSTLERYILWASAWLHDIGMQTLPVGATVGEMTQSQLNQVRHDHPHQSAQEIVNRSEVIGLPTLDVALINAIALIAQAHGTSYYETSLDALRAIRKVRNHKIRGPLLAAILLMADELDLHYERAKPLPPGFDRLSDVSATHTFKHRQVNSCDVTHTGREIRASLTMSASPNEIASVGLVESWIVAKLRDQIAMTEAEVVGGFRGYAEFSRTIRVDRLEGLTGGVTPTDAVVALLELETTASELINHTEALKAIDLAIPARQVIGIAGKLREPFADLDGREDLLAVKLAQLKTSGAVVLASYCLFETSGAASVYDVCREWIEQVGLDPDESPEEEILEFVSRTPEPIALAVSSIDWLTDDELEWFMSRIIEPARSRGDVITIVTAAPGSLDQYTDTIVSAEGLTEQEVAKHLARYMPTNAARASAGANLSYIDYRSLAQNHAIMLREEAR